MEFHGPSRRIPHLHLRGGNRQGIYGPRRHPWLVVWLALWRGQRLRRPARRLDRLGIHSHRRFIHQHPARLWPLDDSREQHRPDHRLRGRIARRGCHVHYSLALLGGWLGVLLMVPLRRQLIVKEHGNLAFPEGTACADVLVAGERGGSFAGRVFWGLGLGGVYTVFMNIFQAWTSQPESQPKWLPGASFRANVTSEYLGVGYIIGPRVAGILFAGGIVSWLVVMPAIRFFGQLSGNVAIYPGTIPIPLMSPDDLWRTYIRPMGAGAVAAAGVITLIRTLPTIVAALRSGLKDVRAQGGGQSSASSRIDQDIPMRTVIVGSIVIIVMLWVLLTFHPMKGASTFWYQNLFAAVFVVVFGFLFVTVASRISGLLGNSSNPVSGMSIATLMATCAIFFLAGWTAPNYAALALMIGGVVCIAAAIAGATSQDLKTGYLVGATPYRQQLGLLIGVTVS